MTAELLHTRIAGWRLLSFAGAGKSALVFKAERDDGEIAAIKIFDPELVERFGKQVQLGRITRELSLRGQHHPNLIKILDGGECPCSKHLFVAMEYRDAKNLEDVLEKIPRDRIWPIISQVASAAKFLESLGLAHRDIKPANIAIDEQFQVATLLDLGVIKPIGGANLTDDDAKPFIGTLQYSSPEFLLRQESDVTEDWRAITYYQLGAVLHDMIMGERIFEDYCDPFAKLVEAVKTVRPRIVATDVAQDLVVLASNCLVKDPAVRSQILDWGRFEVPRVGISPGESAMARVRQRHLQSKGDLASKEAAPESSSRALRRFIAEVSDHIETTVRAECKDSFPRVTISHPSCNQADRKYIRLSFEASAAHFLIGELCVLFSISVLDLASRVIALDCLAGIVMHEIAEEDLVSHTGSQRIVAGVFDQEIVDARVCEVLYVLLDAAQATGETLGASDLKLVPLSIASLEQT